MEDGEYSGVPVLVLLDTRREVCWKARGFGSGHPKTSLSQEEDERLPFGAVGPGRLSLDSV